MRTPAPIPREEAVEEAIPLTEGATGSASAFAALRHRNYQLYFLGQLVSNAGTWMQVIAQGWLVYQLGHSEVTLGLVGFASAIPSLLTVPWVGVIVERVPKRTLLMLTQAGAMLLAFVLAFLAFTDLVQQWHIIALAAGLGLVNSFDSPARQAFVVEMVGREDLPNAIALNSLMVNSARVVGPALGGLILLSLIFSVFAISYIPLLPAFVQEVLKQGAAVYGWLTAAFGAGAVTGAVIIANRQRPRWRGEWMFRANLLFPIILCIFIFNTWLPLSLALEFLLGAAFMVEFTMMNTLLQTNVADHMRGRIMALYTITFVGLAPFGNLVLGALSARYGIGPATAAFAAASLVLSQVLFRRIPQMRALP